MALLRSMLRRNPSMCQSVVRHRVLLVHLEHPPLLRSPVRSVYTFFLLIMPGHEPNLFQPIIPRCLDPDLTYTGRKGEADLPPSKANFVARVQVFRLYLSCPHMYHAAPLLQKAIVVLLKVVVLQKVVVPQMTAVAHQKAPAVPQKAVLLQKTLVPEKAPLHQKAAVRHTTDRKQYRKCYRYRNHIRAATYAQVRRPLHQSPTKFLGLPLFLVKEDSVTLRSHPVLISQEYRARPQGRSVRRFPSGPGELGYDDAERARQERFGEIERQLADITQDAAEAELRRDHDFHEREGERGHLFAEGQADRAHQFDDHESRREADARHLMDEMASILSQGATSFLLAFLLLPTPEAPLPVPGPRFGAPTPSEIEMLGVPEQAESVIASIRRASSEQLQLEREEARAQREALEQQVLAERAHAEEERNARVRELEEELARVRAELDHEKQQRDHDEEQRREADAQRNNERDEEMRQQLNEITDLLLAHREEFARKKETVEEHWDTKQEWRQEDNQRWEDLYRMVQGIIQDRAEDRERCEEERRAAAEKPSTQDIIDMMRSENQTLRELFETLTDSWREETDKQHKELLDTVQSTANERVPFNVQGYLDEFSKSLATEVRMLLGEVGKLREERRNIQFEIGTLLCLRSKYETGGMFDPDWKPSTGPLAPQQPADLPPDEPPAPGPEPPRPGAWRSIHQRGGFKRTRKRSEARPAGTRHRDANAATTWATHGATSRPCAGCWFLGNLASATWSRVYAAAK
ncbi:hypothetical protein EDB89DRAFT_2073048 [Lactarius sanguifluus]|nr:hypothetical protein EDB89DRAFT_2073048 [Lactarius sanguifluus]